MHYELLTTYPIRRLEMTNPYKAKLQRELDSLIRRKTGLRRVLQAGPWAFSGDALDQRQGMEAAARELAAAERRHAELRHLLGLPEPTGPIKIPPIEVSRAQLAASRARIAASRAKAAPTPVHRAPGQYLTKDMAAYLKSER
jgi:hypothetical protein